jgi:hypothetical protein
VCVRNDELEFAPAARWLEEGRSVAKQIRSGTNTPGHARATGRHLGRLQSCPDLSPGFRKFCPRTTREFNNHGTISGWLGYWLPVEEDSHSSPVGDPFMRVAMSFTFKSLRCAIIAAHKFCRCVRQAGVLDIFGIMMAQVVLKECTGQRACAVEALHHGERVWLRYQNAPAGWRVAHPFWG